MLSFGVQHLLDLLQAVASPLGSGGGKVKVGRGALSKLPLLEAEQSI